MALLSYEILTAALLQAPSAPTPLISTSTLDSFINIARNQVAQDGECIRFPAAITVTSGSFAFANITTSAATGVGSVIAIRSMKIGPRIQIAIRAWEWFNAYNLSSGNTGTPIDAAQQGQGINGTMFLDPAPTVASPAVLALDAVCLPIVLVDDTTPEAIPPLWTDAIPYYAAWMGLLNLQRPQAAQGMLDRYKELMRRARQGSTSTELPDNQPGGDGSHLAANHLPVTQPVAQPGQR